MKNKGFTLIELLAVIVIVAIITLIATPIISNVVNNSKVGALKSSAYGLLEASNLYYAQNGSKGIRFDINDNIVTSNDTTKLLNYKGNIKRGTIIIDKKGNTTICITDGINSAYKNYDEQDVKTVAKETCNIPTSSYIVYLENSGATITELTNKQLTEEIASLKAQLALKANQSDLDITNSNLESVSSVANAAATDLDLSELGEGASDVTLTLRDSSFTVTSSHIKRYGSLLVFNLTFRSTTSHTSRVVIGNFNLPAGYAFAGGNMAITSMASGCRDCVLNKSTNAFLGSNRDIYVDIVDSGYYDIYISGAVNLRKT